MPGWCSHALANEIENFIYRGVAITIGATLYLRFLVAPSSRAGGGTETNYGGWARVPLARDTASIWTVDPVSGLLVNGVEIVAPTATTAGNGDLVWFDIVDTASGAVGKIYNGGPISPAKGIIVGLPPTFDPGKLQITY